MRVSKYKQLEGQTFNVKGSSVKVVRYHREVRTSKKTGKTYYAYRLDVQLEGYTDILEISTASWNKQSFIKRLVKTSVNKEVKPSNYLPIVTDKVRLVNFLGYLEQPQWSMINREFGEAFTLKEIKNVYKKYAKHLHPDTNKNVVENEFKILKGLYEYFKEQRIMMVDIVREHGVDMEY